MKDMVDRTSWGEGDELVSFDHDPTKTSFSCRVNRQSRTVVLLSAKGRDGREFEPSPSDITVLHDIALRLAEGLAKP